MAKFIVKGRVKYNGVLYNSGQVVEVQKEHAEEFKKHGWELVKGDKPVDNKPAGQGDNQNKTEQELTEEQIEKLFEQKPELKDLTNAQLEELLEEKGVEFKKGAKKAILLALLV